MTGLDALLIESQRDMIATQGERIQLLTDVIRAAAGYLRNAKIDLETGAPKATALRTVAGGLAMVERILASVDRSPQSHDPAEGHGAEHESAVGNAETPNLSEDHP